MVHININTTSCLKKITFLFLLFCFFEVAQAKVRIFACEPEWAELSKEIGGKQVKVFSATHAKQNPHYIRARPSLVSKSRNADLIFCAGASLEIGWLPVLLQKANSNVQPGKIGYFMASDYIDLIEKSHSHDRSLGDVHPEGNPHVHLNPYNISIIAQELTRRLKIIDKKNQNQFEENYENFDLRWSSAIKSWEENAKSLNGISLIVHHKSFSYLLDWLNINLSASMEPKPGIPPTISHLNDVLIKVKTDNPKMIIRTPYDPDDAGNWLSERTGIPFVTLPYTVKGDEKSNDLFELFNRTILILKEAANRS